MSSIVLVIYLLLFPVSDFQLTIENFYSTVIRVSFLSITLKTCIYPQYINILVHGSTVFRQRRKSVSRQYLLFSVSGDAADGGQSIAMNEKFYFLQTDEMFVDALKRGVPFPILSVADHFTNTRSNAIWPWGRKYWIAGHYAAYLIW